MPLDFISLGILALVFYGVAYFLIRRQASALRVLLSRIRSEPIVAPRSVIMDWVLRGRGTGQDWFAHLFTVFPPLMLLATASGLMLVLLIVIAFLKVAASIGVLVSGLLVSFPFYRTADAFDIYLMTKYAKRVPVNEISKDDRTLLEAAELALATDVRYFGRLSLFMLLVLPLMILYDIVASRLQSGTLTDLSGSLVSFAALVLVIFASTLTVPKKSGSVLELGGDETPEVAPPMAGDHLSYGAVSLLESTRNRLMRKYRPSDAGNEDESAKR